MRYTRIKRQIESGSLIGTNSLPLPSIERTSIETASTLPSARAVYPPSFPKRTETERKRKRHGKAEIASHDVTNGSQGIEVKRGNSHTNVLVKEERSYSAIDTRNFERGSASDSDSEDDMPLAKRRKRTGSAPGSMLSLVQPSTAPATTTPPPSRAVGSLPGYSNCAPRDCPYADLYAVLPCSSSIPEFQGQRSNSNQHQPQNDLVNGSPSRVLRMADRGVCATPFAGWVDGRKILHNTGLGVSCDGLPRYPTQGRSVDAERGQDE